MTRTWRMGAIAVTTGLALAACGGGGDDSGQQPTDGADTAAGEPALQAGFFGDQQDPGQPVNGGVLDFAIFSEAQSLDPADIIGKACCGGTELMAIYDALMRYNPESGEYEPHLAQSLTPSNDFRTWTLTLRPNVNFTDGTPLNAEAVKFSIERYINEDGYLAAPLSSLLNEITVSDPRTVVFELQRPWPAFPGMLADTPGNIVSPAAVERWGDDFGRHPVGAGAFTLESFAPGEEIVVTANPNYWGGRPHLDSVRFIPLQGAETKLDALNTGELDAAILRRPGVNADAVEQGYSGYTNIQNYGGGLFINHRQGRPGADPRVREAIALAIDPKVISERAYEGHGIESKGLFYEGSRWHTDVAPIPYDPARARELLDQAMQDGYDGTIQLTYARTSEDIGLTVTAMLEAVGFSVTQDVVRTVADQIRKVAAERNFELTSYGINIPDASPYPDLFNRYVTENNISGYDNAEFDRLVRQFQEAAGYQAKLEAMAAVQRQWNETVPSVVTHAIPETVAWQDRVHGLVPTRDTMMLLHDAWMSN